MEANAKLLVQPTNSSYIKEEYNIGLQLQLQLQQWIQLWRSKYQMC